MADEFSTANEVFLDTSFAIALTNAADRLHSQALAISAQLRARGVRLLTTQAVMLEIGNALAKRRFRQQASTLLMALHHDPKITIVPLNDELFSRGFGLFRDRSDKEWGLVDCLSFVVMIDRGIDIALSADEHFRQAGFHAVLLG